jgi:hypothetical protein
VVDVYLYMLAAALTIAGLALLLMNWLEGRADVLSGRNIEKNEGEGNEAEGEEG